MRSTRPIRSYTSRMHQYASMRAIEVYYAKVDATEILASVDARARTYLATTIKSAAHHDALHEIPKLTEVTDGSRRIVDHPPIITHPSGLTLALATSALARYRETLQEDRRVLLDRYTLVDTALKVVGVGSVGLYALAALFEGAGDDDPLFLQAKEAEASVLERFLPPGPVSQHGERIVTGQRRLQAASDIFLGWTTGDLGRQVYIRQLQDQKAGAVIDAMTPRRPQDVGRAVRLGPRPRPRTIGRARDDRRVPRDGRRPRRCRRAVRDDVRRPERARLRGAPGGRQERPDHGRDGRLSFGPFGRFERIRRLLGFAPRDQPIGRGRPKMTDDVTTATETTMVRAAPRRSRRILAGVVLVLACLSILFTTVAVWTHQVAFKTERFTALVSTVITDPAVIDPLAERISVQVVDALDVQTRIENRLPDIAKPLAAALTTQIQDAIDRRLQVALANPKIQAALTKTIAFAHERIMNLLRGNSDAISVVDGYVTDRGLAGRRRRARGTAVHRAHPARRAAARPVQPGAARHPVRSPGDRARDHACPPTSGRSS